MWVLGKAVWPVVIGDGVAVFLRTAASEKFYGPNRDPTGTQPNQS